MQFHRCFKRATLIFAILNCIVMLDAQSPIITPGYFDFGLVNTSRKITFKVSAPIINGDPRGCYKITNATFTTTSFKVIRVINPEVRGYNYAMIETEFTPQNEGISEDSLLVSFRLCENDGPLEVIKILVKGDGMCNNIIVNSCDPRSPLCAFDDNTEYRVEIGMHLKSDLSDHVSRILRKHKASDQSYELPFTFLFQLIGLEAVIKLPTAIPTNGLPTECISQECLDTIFFPILFTKRHGTTRVADFDWSWHGSEPVIFDQRIGIPGSQYRVMIKVPDKLSGATVVAPSYIEFFFKEGRSPFLEVQYNGITYYSGDIHCFNTKRNQVLFRHPNPTNSKPNIHLMLKAL